MISSVGAGGVRLAENFSISAALYGGPLHLVKEHPLRADARRKYDRILEVAIDVWFKQGIDASLNEVARRAAVGPGTLYRHFPTREDLLNAVMKIGRASCRERG